jgi:hypothetical protein
MDRTDAALTRRVIRARLTVAASVLGGTLAPAGLGVFGDLSGAPADGDVAPGIATVELSRPVSAQ